MRLFTTKLEIKGKMTRDKFFDLVFQWVQENPHEENIIPNIHWNEKCDGEYGKKGKLSLQSVGYNNGNIIAVRYEKVEDDGTYWDTDYVMNFSENCMTIILDRTYSSDALLLNKDFSTPLFITYLIDKKYIKKDCQLEVSYKPRIITEKDNKMLADIVNDNATVNYKLPIVYVSKTTYDQNPIDVEILAKNLKGAAHVLVQDNRDTNEELDKLCDGKNERDGSIGVYYTEHIHEHKRFPYMESNDSDDILLNEVTQYVITNSNSQHIDDLYTWNGVYTALISVRLKSEMANREETNAERDQALSELVNLKENLAGQEEAMQKEAIDKAKQEISDEFDEIVEENRSIIEDRDRVIQDNERLRAEVEGLHAKIAKMENIPLLFMGKEKDFYTGEIKDLLLSVLSDAKPSLSEDSRRADIVDDIIQNNQYEGKSEKLAGELKTITSGYDRMTDPIRHGLQHLGFEITDDGKHYKVRYYGDKRYEATISCTPSANNAGENIFSDLKKCF